MSVFKQLLGVTRAALIILAALSCGAGLAREQRNLIHKMSPLSADRLDDLIHEFPPLRPIPQPRTRAPEPPREAYDAPTLAEAPRKPSDGPTMEELGVPPPEPPADAGEKFAETLAHASDLTLFPAANPSPLAEAYARKRQGVTASGSALQNAIELISSKLDLEHYLRPPETPPAIPDQPAPPVAPAEPSDEASDASSLYLVAFGSLLALLLLLTFARRKGLADNLLARVAKLRDRNREEEAPTPPVDLSRLERLIRRSAPPPVAPAAEPLREVAEPANAASSPPSEEAAAADMTDDLVLVEPGDAAAASAAIKAARTQREGAP